MGIQDDYVVETNALTKRFGSIVAVDSLSLRVPRGEVFGLLGPNGAGKTTTMGMMLGLVRPTSGSVRLFGKESTGADLSLLRRVAAILETPSFYPYLSGRANLRFFQGISARSTSDDLGGTSDDVGGASDEVSRVLAEVGLDDRADHKFGTYSLGMKQRLGLAYALIGDPDLIILDEPTNGVDPAGMTEVRELIRKLGDDGHTILLSSHLLHEVEEVCDSVAILSRGRLIAQDRVQELLRSGRHTLRISTTDNSKAAGLVSALTWVSGVEAKNGGLLVDAPADRSGDISAALAEHGIHILEMAQSKESLEEYFLEVTGQAAPTPKEERS